MQCLFMGGLVIAGADIMPEITRWIRLAWACYKRFKWELCEKEEAPITLKVSILNTEMMETLLYDCAT